MIFVLPPSICQPFIHISYYFMIPVLFLVPSVMPDVFPCVPFQIVYILPCPSLGGYKRNTSDSPHVQAAVRRIADGALTVAEASIQFDVPIPTLYLNMRRQGIKARGRLGMTGQWGGAVRCARWAKGNRVKEKDGNGGS